MNAQALICDAQHNFALRDVTLPDPGPGDLVIRTLWSGVSIGTEFMMVRSTLDRILLSAVYRLHRDRRGRSGRRRTCPATQAGDPVYFRASPGMLLDWGAVCTQPPAPIPATQ